MGKHKCEMLHDDCLLSEADARTEIFGYLDSPDKNHRKHSSLSRQTPAQFEAKIDFLHWITNAVNELSK